MATDTPVSSPTETLTIEREGFGTLTLKPSQIEHFDRVADMLLVHKRVIDTSLLGCGKTYVSIALAIELGLAPYVICPASSVGMWKRVLYETDIPYIDVISYESLAGKRNCTMSHCLVDRDDRWYIKTIKEKPKKMWETTFTVTDALKRMLTKGWKVNREGRPVFFILDEAHKLKNGKLSNAAVCAISRAIEDTPIDNRMILLSGSIFEKETHAKHMLKVMNFYQSKSLYESAPGGANFEWTGMLELLENCEKIDKKTAEHIWNTSTQTADDVDNVCFRLFVEIVLKNLASSMPPHDQSRYENYNFYANLLEGEFKELQRGVELLHKSARGDEQRGIVDWKGITEALQLIEAAKLASCIRLVKKTLNKPGKVIVFVNFLDSLKKLEAAFKGSYGFVTLQGKVPKNARQPLIDKFQTDANCRIFISTTAAACQSITLDDQVGDAPRTMIMMPDYRMLMCYQATGRHRRLLTKSPAPVLFLFGKLANHEKPDTTEAQILENLARKSQVLMVLMPFLEKAGVRFPGGYTNKLESNDSWCTST